MKNILFVFTLFIACSSFTIFKKHAEAPKPLMASEIMVPVGKNGNQISLSEFVTISPKEYQKASGEKMNVFEKLAFKIAQRKVKKAIEKDGSIDVTKLSQVYNEAKDANKVHRPLPWWGICLIVLGAIVLLIILMNRAYWVGKRNV